MKLLLVIAKDAAALSAFDLTHCGGATLVTQTNLRRRSLAAIANEVIGSGTGIEVFGLSHADVVYGPGAVQALMAEAARGRVAGIVGRDNAAAYRCCSRPEQYDRGAGQVFAGPGVVSTLDGMACFFRPDSGLRFDSVVFDGLHCHVEDLCLQAAAWGIPSVVPLADAYHLDHPPPRPGWMDEWFAYRQRLKLKWQRVEFQTT